MSREILDKQLKRYGLDQKTYKTDKHAQRAVTRAKKREYNRKKDKDKKRWSVTNAAHLKKSALDELNNHNTVMILGHEPRYVHSQQAYFEAGLKTATRSISSILSKLYKNRKQYFNAWAEQIDLRWKKNLEEAFSIGGKPIVNSFEQFKDIWDNQIKINENQFWQDMQALDQYKTYMAAKGALAQKQMAARASALKQLDKMGIKKPQYIKDDILNQINESLINTGFQISSIFYTPPDSKTGESTSNFTWDRTTQGAQREKELSSYANNKFLKQLGITLRNELQNQLPSQDLETEINKLGSNSDNGKQLQKCRDLLDKLDIGSIRATNLGEVFERDPALRKQIDLTIQNVQEKYIAQVQFIGDSQKRSAEETTADTIWSFGFSVKQNDLPKFYFSDKASYIIDEGVFDSIGTDRFEASFKTTSTDFSNLNVQQEINPKWYPIVDDLYNYINLNAAAFKGTSSDLTSLVQDFNKQVVYFGAWVRLGKAILGNLSGRNIASDTPIGIRTPKSIYNIADLLKYIINLGSNPRIIQKFLFQSGKEDFYKSYPQLEIAQLEQLYASKRLAINSIVDSTGYGDLISIPISYPFLKANQYVQSALQPFQDHVKRGISMHFSIKLKNIMKQGE